MPVDVFVGQHALGVGRDQVAALPVVEVKWYGDIPQLQGLVRIVLNGEFPDQVRLVDPEFFFKCECRFLGLKCEGMLDKRIFYLADSRRLLGL